MADARWDKEAREGREGRIGVSGALMWRNGRMEDRDVRKMKGG